MSVLALVPLVSKPTAQQSDVEMQVTLSRPFQGAAPISGEVTISQETPSQRWINVRTRKAAVM
jgi:hypothetical protein